MDLDKIRGGFLGLALGDAIGAPFEFQFSPPLSEYTEVIKLPITWKPRFGTKQYSVVGQVTDDTTMASALLWTIATNKDWVENDVINAYIDWANSGIKFLGRNTRALFKNIKTIKGYKARHTRFDLSNNQSNGSLMRAFPLVLLFYYLPQEKVFEKALNDTKLTNPSPINQDCVLVYLNALLYILNKVPPKDFLPQLHTMAQTKELKEVIYQAINGIDRNVTKNKGWILHSMYCAMLSILLAPSNSFTEVMNWVILKGGDTDTNGAISGSLIGTYYGEKELMKDPIAAQNIKIVLESDYSKGEFPLDGKYHPSTALQILK